MRRKVRVMVRDMATRTSNPAFIADVVIASHPWQQLQAAGITWQEVYSYAIEVLEGGKK